MKNKFLNILGWFILFNIFPLFLVVITKVESSLTLKKAAGIAYMVWGGLIAFIALIVFAVELTKRK